MTLKKVFKIIGTAIGCVALCFIVILCIAVYNVISGNYVSLEYELTEEDYSAFEEAASDFEAAVISGEGELALAAKSSEFVTAYLWIDTQYSIAYLDYCRNMTDEGALSNYKFAFETRNNASNLYSETLKNVLLSDSEYAKVLFEGWSEEEKDMLLNNNDKIYELMNANEALLLEYRALDPGDEGFESAVDEIYLEVVANYNAVAKEYGYSNYYDYATVIENRRDYTAEDRALFRQYVKGYIVPLYEELYARYADLYESADESTLRGFAALSRDNYGDNAEVRGYISDYVDDVFSSGDGDAESVGKNMKRLFKKDRAIFANNEEALDAAYTVYLSYYDEPIVYFGSGYHDMLTVIHESGHYAAFSEYGATNTPLDLCEVQSQTNEWMFISYLEEKVDPAVYELLLLSRLARGFEEIILATAVDECEEQIYSAEALTAESYAKIISDTVKTYGEELSEELRIAFYFRYVAVDNPVYYISYATSELASVSHYIKAETDPNGARDAYVKLIKTVDFVGFKEGLSRCGFLDPFSEDTFKSLVDTFSKDEKTESGEGGVGWLSFDRPAFSEYVGDAELPLAS